MLPMELSLSDGLKMEDTNLSLPIERDLPAAFGRVARLDEALAGLGKSELDVFRASALRREAIYAAALEGASVRMEPLCRMLGNREITNMDRSVRLAAALHDALAASCEWTAPPQRATIEDLFRKSDAAAGRSLKQDVLWTLEEDSLWLAESLATFDEDPEPAGGMEHLREVWTSGRFLGLSRRMALLIAPWVLSRAFECDHPVLGLAEAVGRDVDRYRDAAPIGSAWLAEMAFDLKAIGTSGKTRIGDQRAAKRSMLALCPPEKASSSVERGIDFMMRTPVFSAKSFAESLDLTMRGAKVVLDKLLEADVVEVDAVARNRSFVCRRAM